MAVIDDSLIESALDYVQAVVQNDPDLYALHPDAVVRWHKAYVRWY